MAGKRQLTNDQIEKILELTVLGTTRPDIAKAVKCGKSAVFNYQKHYFLGLIY